MIDPHAGRTHAPASAPSAAETSAARWTRRLPAWLILVSLPIVGCRDESRLIDEQPVEITVGPVTDAGLILDQAATPEQVVFALLRAIHDDVKSGDDPNTRRQAFQRQLDLCAPDTIYARSPQQNLPRNEAVRRIVWHWAPTLAYYVDDFPETWAQAATRLRSTQTPTARDAPKNTFTRVLIELADPSGDPNASVIAQFQLTRREQGLWRVIQVGFVRSTRHLTATPAISS